MLQHANSNNVSYYTIVNTHPTEALSRQTNRWTIFFATLGAVLLSIVVHAIPTTHTVDIGGYDSAYVQGFYDQQTTPAAFGQSGRTRWTGTDAALRLPLLGIPAHITLRVAAPTPKTLTLTSPTTEKSVTTSEPFHWYDVPFDESGSLVKWSDTAVSLRTSNQTWQKGDLREVGVLVDTLTYSTDWFALPYPSTMLLSLCIAALMSYLLCHKTTLSVWSNILLAAALPNGVVAVAWRWPLSPVLVWSNALPWLTVCVGIGVLWHVRVVLLAHWQRMQERYTILVLFGWNAWMMLLQQSHVTLAVPGVEKDFRSFASRSDAITDMFRADPFYQMGYPFVLWLGRTLSGASVFSVATFWAICAATLTICAAWYCARHILGRGWDLVALAIILSSSFFVDYALLVGSDMTFTAAASVALATLFWAMAQPDARWRWGVVGISVGVAFLVRHTGLVLIAPVLCAIFLCVPSRQKGVVALIFFSIGCVLAAAPQLFVNVRDTGQLFFHHQAKNSWLAVYGNMDWGRWGDVPDDIALLDVILMDPSRFALSWWNSVVSVFGTGADVREYDTALWQRLLNVPFNWLSIIGIVWGGWKICERRLDPHRWVLVTWSGGFIAVSAIAFILPRMLLPLLFVAAVCATDGMRVLAQRLPTYRWLPLALLLIYGMLQAGYMGSQRLLVGQPADERAALAYIRQLDPQRLAVLVPAESPAGKYSVLSERVVLRVTRYPVDAQQLCSAHPDYVLWSNELVPPDSTLVPIDRFGRYWIFRMADSPAYCTPP